MLSVKIEWWCQTANSSLCLSGTDFGFSRFTRRTMSRTVVWNCFFLLVNGTSAISASEIQHCSSSSQIVSVYWIGVQASAPIVSIAVRMVLVTATARARRALAFRQAAATLREK
ncbi:hypothetical protein ACFVRD_29045 [Streptomyces sp. NPDC057908]|uniref:hypothetical protein n=1 Tax=unclassified Streptomyces TaxID=2593676 RepID=UPI002E131095|nr:hypothetical protein OG609_28810 [Streptomyces sp. NBC_01224]